MADKKEIIIAPLNVEQIKADFPILKQEINGHRLVYLDNAASTHKPNSVINAYNHYIESSHSNIHQENSSRRKNSFNKP